MGQQLREVLREEGLSEQVIERLRNALRIRNHLAHDFFREHAERFLTFEGRNQMLTELQELRAELEETDNELEPITRHLFATKGIKAEMMEAEFERIRAKARDGLG